ncbi:MAG: hypothetical protein RLZZ126_1278 [Pseudomonadota bacterium]
MIALRNLFTALAVMVSFFGSVPASATVVEYISPTQSWSSNCINGGSGNFVYEGCIGNTGTVATTVATVAGLNTHISFDVFDCCGGGYEYVQWNSNTLSFVTDGHWDFDVIALGNDVLSFLGRNDPSFTNMMNISVTQDVPEPGSLALVALALAGLSLRSRRKA